MKWCGFEKEPFESRIISFVKGIAIMLIFGHHWARSLLEVNGENRPTLMQWHFIEPQGNFRRFFQAINNGDALTAIEQGLGHWGYAGVNMFIVISGLGLAYGVVNRTKDWAGFLVRRGRKILPAFFCVVLAFGLLQYVSGIHATLLETTEAIFIKASLLFFWNPDYFFNDNSPLWFIGLILPLYLCFPLFYNKAEKTNRWKFLLLLVIFSSLVKFFLQNPIIANWHPYLFHGFFLARLPEFYFGVILGYLYRRDGKFPFTVVQLAAIAAISGVVVVVAHLNAVVYILLDPFLAVISICLALILYNLWKKIHLNSARFICFIGGISFPFYLVHRPIITVLYQNKIFDAVSGAVVVLQSIFVLIIVLCVAWCMNIFFQYTSVIPATVHRVERQ